jgi:hypothetical protein
LGHRALTVSGEPSFAPTYPPGLPLQFAAATALAGDPGLRWVVPSLGALAVWLTFVLGRRLGSGRSGLAAAVWLATSPVFLLHLLQPMSDVPVTAWWLLALALLVPGRPTRPHLGSHAAASPTRAALPQQGADDEGAPAEARAGATASAATPTRHAGRPLAARMTCAGLAAGVALLTRPNLAPLLLLVAPLATLPLARPRPGAASAAVPAPPSGPGPAARVAWFALGLLPALLALGWVNARLYGAPWATGYGEASQLFDVRNAGANLRLYASWLVEVHAPLLALAGAGVVTIALARGAASRWLAWLIAFALLLLGCYLPYATFESWTYLRFLLPAIAVIVLVAAHALDRAARVLPPLVALPVLALLAVLLAGLGLGAARDRGVFTIADREQRYRDAAGWVAAHTSPVTPVLAAQHSGSVHHHARRAVIRWDLLPPGQLAAAWAGTTWRAGVPAGAMPGGAVPVDAVPGPGMGPATPGEALLVLDADEEPAFRARFAAHDALGALDWPPVAATDSPYAVRIYRASDRARYLAGAAASVARVP